jgi:hypothetical protein
MDTNRIIADIETETAKESTTRKIKRYNRRAAAQLGSFGEDDRVFLRIDHTLLVLSYFWRSRADSRLPDGCSRRVVERGRGDLTLS